MDENEVLNKSKNPEPAKATSKWAKIAIWCVGLGYIAPIISWILMRFLPVDFEMKSPLTRIAFYIDFVILFTCAILIILGLITGIIAFIHIILKKRKLKGIGKAITSIILGVIFVSLACAILIPTISRERMISQRDVCIQHISSLGTQLKIYADKYGKYPHADKWCDILLQSKDVNENLFKCPGNKKARCSYAINPNCEPNSPEDTVLLFETRGGWNAYGGSELMTADNHWGEGEFIFYNGGYARFEVTDPNHELNWGEKSKGRGLK